MRTTSAESASIVIVTVMSRWTGWSVFTAVVRPGFAASVSAFSVLGVTGLAVGVNWSALIADFGVLGVGGVSAMVCS
jgi:hypothetical protein